MKFLIVLCAVAACAVAKPYAGYSYSAYAPLASPLGYYGAAPYSAYPYAAPYTGYPYATPYSVAAPVAIKTQYHAQDELGQASYGFSEPNQAQAVVRDAAGNQAGSWSYINPEGKLVQTSFVADALGFRVASNDLPVAPQPLPVEPQVLPEPVQDTPEVAEAKAKFLKEFDDVKSRSRRSVAVQTPASTAPLTAVAPVAPVAPIAPLAYSAAPIAPLAYSAAPLSPLAYSAPIAPLAYRSPLAYSGLTPYSYPYSYGYGYGLPYNYV